ncbi:MAG: NAD(P)H-dependent oxidoreductase subunit E [Symbiobacteriaceae bacterium]|nr:NAD(P)H-dependent oxidoreductase subunit E [Symbiobacteriaceae bacterium]
MSQSASCLTEKYGEIDKYIDNLPSLRGALVTVLHQAQTIYGYLPEELQLHIARRLNVPAAQVYGVVSFYSFFTMEPKGQCAISLCMGTACFVLGAGGVLQEFEKELGIKAGETTPDNLFSLDALRCVGACSLAPVVLVGDKVYGKATTSQVRGIIEEHMQRMAKGGGSNE